MIELAEKVRAWWGLGSTGHGLHLGKASRLLGGVAGA